MKRLLPLAALAIALGAQADDRRDTLYQISTIDALLSGVYDPLARLADVLPHGDFGLGTFESLDGELILLDGQIYRAGADGQVTRMPPETATPFVAVTRFDADQVLEVPPGLDYAAFRTWLEARLPSRNIPYAVRLDGRFEQVAYRSVPRQDRPFRPLGEVQQSFFEQGATSGTLVGFWCPAFTKGVNVPGFHLHFLADDRHHPGHLLDFRLAAGKVQLDLTDDWQVALPMAPAFLERDLSGDRSATLHAVEQGKSGQ